MLFYINTSYTFDYLIRIHCEIEMKLYCLCDTVCARLWVGVPSWVIPCLAHTAAATGSGPPRSRIEPACLEDKSMDRLFVLLEAFNNL